MMISLREIEIELDDTTTMHTTNREKFEFSSLFVVSQPVEFNHLHLDTIFLQHKKEPSTQGHP